MFQKSHHFYYTFFPQKLQYSCSNLAVTKRAFSLFALSSHLPETPPPPSPLSFWCWELVGGGQREQGDGSPSKDPPSGISRVLLYLCRVTTGRIGVRVQNPFVLLDEISGGCLVSAALFGQHLSAVLGPVVGCASPVPPHVAARSLEGEQPPPYAKGNPTPHPGLPSPLFFEAF